VAAVDGAFVAGSSIEGLAQSPYKSSRKGDAASKTRRRHPPRRSHLGKKQFVEVQGSQGQFSFPIANGDFEMCPSEVEAGYCITWRAFMLSVYFLAPRTILFYSLSASFNSPLLPFSSSVANPASLHPLKRSVPRLPFLLLFLPSISSTESIPSPPSLCIDQVFGETPRLTKVNIPNI